MDDLRQQLMDAGWRQGVLVSSAPFAHSDAFALVVLNQTCDCINPNFGNEPWLELLPLVKLTGKPDSRMKNGRNPRQIHFEIRENGKDIWVQAKICEVIQFDRAEQLSLTIAGDISLPPAVLEDLIQWRAERYVRPAFPDAFEKSFRPLTDRFAKVIGAHDQKIDSILISLTPFEELVEGESYEIELHLMIKPAIMAMPAAVEELGIVASSLGRLLEESPAISSAKCYVTGLDMMTLWEARQFFDFTRYDYLSFGQDDAAPDLSNFTP